MTIDTQWQTIAPHGGELVNRRASKGEREELKREAGGYEKVVLGPRNLSDLEMISTGVYSPLAGFMVRDDYESVVETMRLKNGHVWSMPITLSANDEESASIREGDDIALADGEGRIVATMTVEEKYPYDKQREAKEVYRTNEEDHPGVANVYSQGDTLLGGKVTLLEDEPNPRPFPAQYYEPAELRKAFEEKGWSRVVGFQTRNPVHRAHEYIQKSALEIVDGLLLNPLVGETKSDDISAPVRMKSYETILNRYYPKDRTLLAVFPAAMRYAGPREAVFHAMCRKNYGCTHFIIGRDHAGVGSYYGTYDAQHIFENFTEDELGITPLKFEHAFFCLNCGNMATTKTCPHDKDAHVFFSGTRVREMLAQGEYPPPEFSRPEVVEVLIKGLRDEEKTIRQPRTYRGKGGKRQ
ncbi:MAG: sulfate adenylyltransferase [Rubrobacteraceae bacterium]